MHYNPQQGSNIGGMYNNIPPNPIGHICPIGYGGYNNGYYNSNYNRYDPYKIQQQYEIQLAQQRESERHQSSMLKKLQKSSSTYLGLELTEEELRKYDIVNEEDITKDFSYEEKQKYYSLLAQEEYRKYQRNIIINMQGNSRPYINNTNAIIFNNMYEKAKKEIPDDVGLVEYLEKYAPGKYVEALMADQLAKQRDLRRVYNSADYGKLINIHKSTPPSMFGNVFNPNASIEDQEIRLPNFISEQTRQERRQRFLDSIMKNGGGLNG